MSDDVEDIPADRLVGIIQIWLWEFEEPENWPTTEDVLRMIARLRRRPDAHSQAVGEAIRECEDYLRV